MLGVVPAGGRSSRSEGAPASTADDGQPPLRHRHSWVACGGFGRRVDAARLTVAVVAATCRAVFGGVRLGRTGTRYVSVVTPPLAFAGTILVSVILSGGFKISQIGIDFIAALASVAPYLIISALYGWFMYFNEKAKSRPSRKTTI